MQIVYRIVYTVMQCAICIGLLTFLSVSLPSGALFAASLY